MTLIRDAARWCSCTADRNNPDLQKSSERTGTRNVEEKKSLSGDETASEKNRYAHALMSESQRNSEASGEKTLKIEVIIYFRSLNLKKILITTLINKLGHFLLKVIEYQTNYLK